MSIIIKYIGEVRDYMGKKQDIVDGINNIGLIDLLKSLNGKLGPLSDLLIENDTVKPVFVIAVNGKVIKSEDYKNIIVKDNDEIVIFPPAGGGI